MTKKKKDEKEQRLEDQLDEFSNDRITEKSEIEGAADVLFEDKTDPNTKLSSIDLRTRLLNDQVPCIAVADELSKLGIIPSANSFTRNLKRLNVSINGQGRQELVNISTGVIQTKTGTGAMERLGNLFRPKDKI